MRPSGGEKRRPKTQASRGEKRRPNSAGLRGRRTAPAPRGSSAPRRPFRPASSRGVDPRQLQRLVGSQPWALIEPYLLGSRSDVAFAMDRLKTFASLVIHWNRTGSNVMGKNDESRIVVRHLAESLAPARAIHELGIDRWLDFGSGAGFPAIPLAIAGIGKSWLLVESRRQKTLFLRKAIESLKLEGVEVATTRLESLEPDRAGFGGFTSRATEGLDLTLELAAKRVVSGGRAVLWRGGSRSAELAGNAWRTDWEMGKVTKLPDTLAEVAEFIRK